MQIYVVGVFSVINIMKAGLKVPCDFKSRASLQDKFQTQLMRWNYSVSLTIKLDLFQCLPCKLSCIPLVNSEK